ncbi:methyltransferase [Skermanella aerolata]|uniref:Methyltransferase n=1 Tax=Skermanella aerolata TaxID=393310 RepID=A0A512E2S5_9PROT|nr:class I SAM-dependent methyltransferase [Skermanella aerolata]KJB90252.1 methyltransferase [Skermanella aerolata KACC 11604]GEO42986.1 methyltransferase [Skermanella aerolata]
MAEVNLLRRYPNGKRSVQSRAERKTEELIRIARQYGQEYFDGPREFGYGGYRYDGRWIPIAEDIIAHFNLKSGMRVLDLGCAKGFLVKDLMKVQPGLEAFGLDISEYALLHCEPEVTGRLHIGNVKKLPFPDASFDAVVCVNTLHNLPREEAVAALREIERVSRHGNSYVQVDSYRNDEERKIFEDWVLTAYTHGYPDYWKQIFDEAGYTGDYFWTYVL